MTYIGDEAVPSGPEFVINEVDGREPSSLDQFLGHAALTVVIGDRSYRMVGFGTQTGDMVTFQQKDLGSAGKDVRVWIIRDRAGEMVAKTAERR